MDTLRWVLGWFLVVLVPPAILYWVAVHPLAALWRRVGAWAGIAAGFAVLIAGAVALAFPARQWLVPDYGLSWPLAVVGVVLVGLAVAVQRARRKWLTTRILLGVPEVSRDPAASRLLTEGIYARIRHPRYVEFTLAMTGYALIANRPAGYLAVVGGVLGILLIVVLEERELRQRFGQAWADYAAATPRFVPRRR